MILASLGYHVDVASLRRETDGVLSDRNCVSHERSQRNAHSQSNPHESLLESSNGPVIEMHTVPRALKSAALQRQQLVAAFTNGIPWIRESRSSHQITIRLNQWLTPDEPLAVMAHDSLLLAQLASVSGDANLAEEASRLHVKALRYLRYSLGSVAATRSNGILSAVDALGVCEMFEELSQSSNAWRHHCNALARLLDARGPDSLDYKQPLTRTLVFNAVHLNLMDALSSRVAFIFGREDWLRHLEANCKGRQWCLVHISCRVPALLERLDRRVALAAPPKADGKLYKDLARLDLQLARWLQAWYLEDVHARPVTVDIEEFPSFVALYGTVSRIFPVVYKFGTLESALGHVSFWLMRLPLLEAIHNLFTHKGTQHLVSPVQRAQIALELERCADSICQSAPALIGASPETSIGVQTMRGVYLWTLAWYTKSGCEAKAQYCRALLHINPTTVGNVAKGVVTHDKQTIAANAFVVRRMLWLESVGPSACHLER